MYLKKNNEMSTLSRSLGICELYHPKIHGNTDSSSRFITRHYIVHCIVEAIDFMTPVFDVSSLERNSDFYDYELDHLTRRYKKITSANRCIKHPIIENYDAIIRKNNYIKLDIIETHILGGMEEIAVLKTFWLRLVQRKWKRLYKIKMEKIKKKMSYHYLKRRELFGK